jgi:hypothetical protein
MARVGRPDWVKHLEGLRLIDWDPANPLWERRAVLGGRVSQALQNVVLTASEIKTALGLPLSETERHSEAALKHSKRDEGKRLVAQTGQAAG